MSRWICVTWLMCAVPLAWIGIHLVMQSQIYKEVIGAGFLAAAAACALEAGRTYRKWRTASRSL